MLTGTIQIDISLHAYNNYATVPALYIGCHQPNKCSIQQRGKVIERQRSRKKTHRKCIQNSIHGECQSENTC